MPPRDGSAIADRFVSFRVVTEAGKGDLEREHERRQRRYERLEERVAGLEGSKKEDALRAFAQREEEGLLARCKVWTTADFEQVAVLGEGSFGVVHLVKRVGTEEHYALKQMQKAAYTKHSSRARVFAERNLLAERRSRWFVDLLTTFQDAEYVYMAMEFLQGGDLFLHIARRGRFTPRETCFYMAELLEALDTVHKSGFIHRDVKPDNIVLSASGHLKLLDFGLCLDIHSAAPRPTPQPVAAVAAGSAPAKGRARLRSLVGTPQYMAPEILTGNYGPEVDIWAFGILTFECLTGMPFFDVDMEAAQARLKLDGMIRNHSSVVPRVLHSVRDTGLVPPSAEQLLLGVVRGPEARLTEEECRREPFFSGIDFARLHLMKPPFDIKVSSPTDVRYFQAGRLDGRYRLPPPKASELALKDEALEWGRYEFDRRAFELQALEVGAL